MDFIGRTPRVSLDIIAVGDGYPANGKVIVERLVFSGSTEDGFLKATINSIDSRPFTLYKIEDSVETSVEMLAQCECLHASIAV